jgi:glycerophosphoryl diester phosphodiesterase
MKNPINRASSSIVLAFLMAGCATQFDLQGHRGARGLLPENTLPAFAKALEVGVTTLELDVGVTKDGVVVVAHDRSLNPAIARDASGQWVMPGAPTLRSLTYAQVQSYDVGRLNPGSTYAKTFAAQQAIDGTRMPTLAQVFALASKHGNAVRFNVETKIAPDKPEESLAPEPFVRAVIAEIRKAGVAHRTTLQSFDWRTLLIAQREAPEIKTVYLTIQTERSNTVKPDASGLSPWLGGLKVADHGDSVPRLVKAAGGAVWSPYFADVTSANLNESQSLNLPVVVWTVNEVADIVKMLDLGVDGIISDYPDRVAAELKRRGMRY